MDKETTNLLDALLRRAVCDPPGVPGVVAAVTDRAGTFYQGAAGLRRVDQPELMTVDTELAIMSMTKAVAATAVLQLTEQDRLDLDAPAKDYLAELGAVQVLDGFHDDGTPSLRPPKRDITTRMLLLHTAGFGYDNFNPHYARLVDDGRLLSPGTASKGALTAPLLFDPGDDWEYGLNMDWAGRVVEAVTGRRLGEILQSDIFDPLGMSSTAFTMTDDMRSRLALIHQRLDNGHLQPLDYVLEQNPEIQMSGHGLYSTAGDFTKFLRMWLDDGAGPHGRVLRPETVDMAAKNGLGDLKVKPLPGIRPGATRDVDLFPGTSKSWALGFMVNDEPAPTGRPAGTLSWAGLANSFFWIDRKNGLAGFWGTQVLPFMDPYSVNTCFEFETAVYRHHKAMTGR